MRVVLWLWAIALIGCTALVGATVAQQPVFGTFSQSYLDQRQLKAWKKLCKGGGRYQAMAEAYELQKPDPCNPKAKEWVR